MLFYSHLRTVVFISNGKFRYFMNSFFLGVYMLAANIMLVNLLVALFATTYEIVQVSHMGISNS